MRIATPADIDTLCNTIALAFVDDPVWGAALTETDAHEEFWRFFVEGAVSLGMVYVTDGDEAVAVWIPPGEPEMSDADLAGLTALVERELSPEAQRRMFALIDRFEEHHQQTEPHAYLTILATRPEHRGHGFAQQLVRDNLAAFDAAGVPTYLESTNPANDHRYERLGFTRVGTFEGVTPGSIVSTMWRSVP